MFSSTSQMIGRSAPTVAYPTFCFTSLNRFKESVSFFFLKKADFLKGIYLRKKTRTKICVTNGIRTRDDYRDTKGFDRTRHRLPGRCHCKALAYETAIIQSASLALSADLLFRFQRRCRFSIWITSPTVGVR